MIPDSKIYVAGHGGLVGSALVRRLRQDGYGNLVVRSRRELDLADGRAVHAFFQAERPEYVFLAAARVGGILANHNFPADFIRDNLAIELNVIDAAYRAGARKLLFFGSSCIYPKHAPQPIREEYLLSGALEPTNEPYAIAKIAGIALARSYRRQYGADFVSVMPTNLYGPGDNFDLDSSHVLPALIRKFHEARLADAADVTVWGSGTPRRELLHVDDVADASLFIMQHGAAPDLLNVGYGEDYAIADVARMVAEVVGYTGRISFDRTKPDGTPRKLLDSTRLRELGWRPRIDLRAGIESTYRWYVDQLGPQRVAVCA